jgi:hypothetical protein
MNPGKTATLPIEKALNSVIWAFRNVFGVPKDTLYLAVLLPDAQSAL